MNRDPEHWERIKGAFEAMLETPPPERAEALQTLEQTEPEIAASVRELIRNLEDAGSFLEHPVATLAEHRNFGHGDVVAGRFRIVRILGAGGMGEVYEAEDLDLGERVALKAIRTSLACRADILDRFKQEVQTARRIAHPGVCRAHDLERHILPSGGAVLILTMELLSGETLRDRLNRSPGLSAAEVREIALQIASGIAAAHEVGILHRDLKPGNVMLTEKPGGGLRAVITDFGLAGTVQDGEGERPALGTLGYIAPEVLGGRSATPAVDIFAFGIVLREMLTAQRSDVGMPRFWRHTIARCTSEDPNRRASAASIVATLKGRAAVRRRKAVAVAAIVASIFGAWRFYIQRAVLIAPGSTFMLADLQNATGETGLEPLADLLRTQLRQSPHFNLWDRARLPEVQNRMRRPGKLDEAGWREAAMRDNVPVVLFTRLARVTSGYELEARLERTGPSARVPLAVASHISRCDTRAHLYDCARDSTLWVRGQVGESPRELANFDQPPQQVTTASWDALALYSDAERLQASGDPEGAVLRLREAVALDPEFAMARMRLGDILNTLRRREEGYREWKLAIDEGRRQRLTKHEALALRSLYLQEISDEVNAEASLVEWVHEYPNEPIALFHLSTCERNLGHYSAALEAARKMKRLAPGDYLAAASVAYSLLLLGDLPGFAREAAEMRKLRDVPVSVRMEAIARFLQGDEAGAQARFEEVVASANPVEASSGVLTLASFLADTGRLDEAEQVLRRGLAADRAAGRTGAAAVKLSRIAFLEVNRGHRSSARAAALDAVSLNTSPEVIRDAGVALARAGFPAEAQGTSTLLDQTLQGAQFDIIRLRLRGEIQLARHEYDAGVLSLQAASRETAPSMIREYMCYAFTVAGDRVRAVEACREIVDHPALVWYLPESLGPGILYFAKERLKGLE